MAPDKTQPSFTIRVIGWITAPILYVVLIRVVISNIRHPPGYNR